MHEPMLWTGPVTEFLDTRRVYGHTASGVPANCSSIGIVFMVDLASIGGLQVGQIDGLVFDRGLQFASDADGSRHVDSIR